MPDAGRGMEELARSLTRSRGVIESSSILSGSSSASRCAQTGQRMQTVRLTWTCRSFGFLRGEQFSASQSALTIHLDTPEDERLSGGCVCVCVRVDAPRASAQFSLKFGAILRPIGRARQPGVRVASATTLVRRHLRPFGSPESHLGLGGTECAFSWHCAICYLQFARSFAARTPPRAAERFPSSRRAGRTKPA